MKSFLRVLVCSILLFAGVSLRAQSGSLPAASVPSATATWSLPSNCTTTNSCQFQVYRCTGSCTVTSTLWTLVATTAAQATSYKDTSVIGGTQYTYDIEAVPTGSTSVYSGPSNTGQVTVQFVPLPPVIGTVTTP